MKKANQILILSAFLLTFMITKSINVMQDTTQIPCIQKLRDDEKWVPFKECPHFLISNSGRLYNTRTKHERKLSKKTDGYLGFTLFRGTKGYTMHICVADHFKDRPQSQTKLQVNHIDFDITNNNDWNLEYVTHLENVRHSIKSGRMPRGSKRAFSKLDELSVRIIREAIAEGYTYFEIARYFKVSNSCIYNIKAGRNWTHV